MWEHQEFDRFYPSVAVEVTTRGANGNTVYSPSVDSDKTAASTRLRCAARASIRTCRISKESAFWTFNGTVPSKLLMGRYGEGILFRHHNGLSPDVTNNGGFGRHTISTHEHNGHHGAENDGFTGAFFFPNQF